MQRKGGAEKNILLKSNQTMQIEGWAESINIMYITRDPVERSISKIELPGQTAVPGGVRQMGEFNCVIQFGRDQDRLFFRNWFDMCVDHEGKGIDPTFARAITIQYNRLHNGNPGNYNTGSQLKPVLARLVGCFPLTNPLPDFDLDATEGEGYSQQEISLHYDDAFFL